MALCGAPVETPDHAEYMTNFALAIIKAIANINDPSTQQPIRIRVGKSTINYYIIYNFSYNIYRRYSQWNSSSRRGWF